jgi:hypothetical protein
MFSDRGTKRLFMFVLFNDAVSNSDCSTSSGLMIVNNEFGKAVDGSDGCLV